jgi:hypothetical protein
MVRDLEKAVPISKKRQHPYIIVDSTSSPLRGFLVEYTGISWYIQTVAGRKIEYV